MVLTNRRIGPGEAMSIGLARIVVATVSLMEEAEEIARDLATSAELHFRLPSELFLEGSDMSLAA